MSHLPALALCVVVAATGCSASTAVTEDGGLADAARDAGPPDAARDAEPVDLGGDSSSSGCSPDLVVVGPQRSWLDAPRDVLTVGCPGTETLTVLRAGVPVPATGAVTDRPGITAAPVADGVLVTRDGTDCGAASVRMETPYGCVVQTMPAGGFVGMYSFYFEVHTCASGESGLGGDHPLQASFLSNGHATACTSAGDYSAATPSFEEIDESFGPCTYLSNCTPLRFDRVRVDTPAGAGLDHVPMITGPASATVAVGGATTACFAAPTTPGAFATFILDDGWTYDAPPIVSVAPAHTDFGPVPDCAVVTGVAAGSGMLVAHLADAALAVPLTVR